MDELRKKILDDLINKFGETKIHAGNIDFVKSEMVKTVADIIKSSHQKITTSPSVSINLNKKTGRMEIFIRNYQEERPVDISFQSHL